MRPAWMTRSRNWRVRASRGAPKIASGGPCSRMLTGVEEADAVGDVAGEAHLVGGDDHRHARRREPADDVEHLGDELRVERARDLVEQQQVGSHRERADDRDPLLLAARQPVRVLVALVGEAESRQQLVGPCLRLAAREPEDLAGRERDVASARSCAGTGCRPGTRCRCGGGSRSTFDAARRDLLALHDDPACVDRLQQVDAAKQRGLAGARRPDEADDLVLGDDEVDALEDLEVPEGLVKALDTQRLGRATAPVRGSSGARELASPVAGDEPVDEPRERDRHHQEDQRGHEVRREVEGRPSSRSGPGGRPRPAPRNETSAVSFESPMASLRSGGMTRRTA